MKTLSAPLSVCFGITNACNLSCKHCLAQNTRGARNFTREELFDIIAQLAEMKVLNVAIFGGEPLLSPHFHAAVDALSKYNFALSLNTNGTRIDADEAAWLARSKIQSFVVSIDGSSSAVHDPFRGEGSFDAAVAGIRALIAERQTVVLSVTVTTFNVHDLEAIASLGQTLGVSGVRFNTVFYGGNAECFSEDLRISIDDLFASFDRMRLLRERFGDFISGSHLQQVDILDQIERGEHRLSFPLTISPCGAATSKCTIRPDGGVTPCELMWDTVVGDIHDTPLHELWHSAPRMQSLRETFTIEATEIPECVGCKYVRLCYLGHRCTPYYEPGSFQRKEFFCLNKDVVSRR